MNHVFQWLMANYVEVLGTILGFLYIVFSIRQNILTWLTGLLTSALYIYVFFVSKFYADMTLQVYYVLVSIYGWYHWAKGRAEKKEVPVTHTQPKEWIWLSLASVSLFALIYFVLSDFTDSPLPLGDATTTALSIVATWMLARKMLEHWLIWIFVDALSLGLYIYKGLWATSVLFFVYTIMAYLGYVKWKKEIKEA